MIILVLVMEYVLNHTKFGRYTIAIGSNKEAAALSGINVKFYHVMVYVVCGLFTGLAACIAIPAAIAGGMDASAAVALAVPFGVLGVLINNVRRTINTFFCTRADACIEKKEYDKLSKYCFVLPWLTNGVLYFTPVFIATWLGTSVVQSFISIIPQWLMNGLANAGNMLPALGFALTLVVMGKQKYLPFFVLGFFLYAILGFSMLTGAVIAVCLALIVSLFVQEDSQEVDA